jgi:hypothetical protein
MADSVVILKALNLPADILKASLSRLSSLYELTDAIAVVTLRPSFDLVKRKVPEGKGTTRTEQLPVSVNLVFDAEGVDPKHLKTGIELAGSQFAHIDASHFDSYEAFSNFVVHVGLPGVKLPEDFWIPVQAVLTHREMEVLHRVYEGQSSKQIAETLTVSPRTVELHRQNCSAKLGPLTPRLLGALFSTDSLETYQWCTTNPPPANKY